MSLKEAFLNNPIVFLIVREWNFSKGNRKNLVWAWIMFFFGNVFDFFRPLVIAFVLNRIQTEGVSSGNIWNFIWMLSIFIFLEIAFWSMHGPARVMELKNAFLVRANFKKYMVDGTMNLNATWHTNHHSGDTIDKIEKGSQAMYEFSGRNYEIIEVIIRFISAYIALTYFNLHSSYIVIFVVIIAIGLILKFDKVLIKQYKVIFGAENKISAKVYDIISNITTVIILRIEKLVSKEIWKKIMFPYKIYSKNRKINETKWFLVSICGAFMTFAVLSTYIYSAYIKKDMVMLGTIFVLYTYVDRIAHIFFHFAYRYGDIVRQRTKVANSEEISKEFIEVKKRKRKFLDNGWKNIIIENLNFFYEGDKRKLHLDNLNMIISKGQRIALVGSSGSGKTTALKVIRELYPFQSGKIYLNKTELENGFKDISRNISLIPQEPEIFSTTIKENITVGINHNLKEIKKYVKIARFGGVVKRLPKGYNSSVVEKGVNLSGGEKQRLALARGLMASKDKEIILLDEPTSSVDSKNELEIYTKIFSTFKGKTILSSIHRLHLLGLFDKIYYFKAGKIVAEGTFEGLLKSSKEFKKLWNKYNKTHKDQLLK